MSETFLGANTVFHQQNAVRVDGMVQMSLTLADSNALDVAEGTLSFRFEAASLSSMQGLYSRDAIFHSGDAEHMSIFLTGTTLRVQIESQYKTQVLNFDGDAGGRRDPCRRHLRRQRGHALR
jgi:hypothetical protein